MAPTKFKIYVDESIRPQVSTAPAPTPAPDPIPAIEVSAENIPRFLPEAFKPEQRLYVDLRQIYPVDGGEYSIEELNMIAWQKRQKLMAERRQREELERENEELKMKIEYLLSARPQAEAPIASNRLSVVPQSLQPAQGADGDTTCQFGASIDTPTDVYECWKNETNDKFISKIDKFTVPIDNSQYIRENVPTSTPTTKKSNTARRMSRPSTGGSPTLKLSPIVETSRDCNSKSSSSSSSTPGTAKKPLVAAEPHVRLEYPERPLDLDDPTSYHILLHSLAEPIHRRSGYLRINENLPPMKNGESFRADPDLYLIGEEVSPDARIYTAYLFDDSMSNGSTEIPPKSICFRFDQPANEWLFYICTELHRRLVREKTKPDIELAVMNAEPGVIYNDGSIMIDEHYRFISLEDFLEACKVMKKPFPKSVAAYLTLELIQLIRVVHSCDIIHKNIHPKNVVITGTASREDVTNVDDRISVIKLIGFDRAMDTRLLPADSAPWTTSEDWASVLNCIHEMLFLESMNPVSGEDGLNKIDRQFKNFPTTVWSSLFATLLNIDSSGLEANACNSVIDSAVDELSTWVKANIKCVLKEALDLELSYEDHCKATHKPYRV